MRVFHGCVEQGGGIHMDGLVNVSPSLLTAKRNRDGIHIGHIS